MKPPFVFISYSHNDEVWKDRLLSHLKVLEGQARLEAWADSHIEVGDNWEARIQAAMAQTDIAIWLVSRHSLTSKYILEKEVPFLLERRRQGKLRFIPVIAESCVWDLVSWLKDIQAYPKGNKCLADFPRPRREKELSAIVKIVVEFIIHATSPFSSCTTFSGISKEDYDSLKTAIILSKMPVKNKFGHNIPAGFNAEEFLQVIKNKIPDDSYEVLKKYNLQVIPKGSYYLIEVFDPQSNALILFFYSCDHGEKGWVLENPDKYDVNHVEMYDNCKILH